LAHARGQVLFLAGAGVSRQADLPDFRGLVLKVYERLDLPVHTVLSSIPSTACSRWSFDPAGLTNPQIAEVRRFIAGDYDVVLGMLERRFDGISPDRPGSMVRNAVAAELRIKGLRPAPIHRALMRLANRGGAGTILVPFKCWSLLDYGLDDNEDGEAKLTMIVDRRKAEAFLKLIDLTVGRSKNSVIPHELGTALDQIETAGQPLARDPGFLRLVTTARRP
jgi:hypothetical protein